MTDDELIQELEQLAHSSKSPKKQLLRAKEYEVALGDATLAVKSWRMQDYAYKTEPCPFPTRARGLFTVSDPLPDGRKILVRGYDKFFNVGEVSWTKASFHLELFAANITQWESIAKHAKGPFYLTVKSNGCIIFISALSESELIVTSKHSLGDAENNMLHAIKGNEWLDRCVSQVNKTRADLAKVLWSNRWTAIAELCDDSFEEHVLAYAPEETGLHLHGINVNSALLSSLQPDQVKDFAKQYGFIQTEYLVMDTVEEVKKFTDACSKDDGRWNGKHVEGFVVRSHNIAHDSPQALSGDTFMFKVKFEQPYLRWREWRELTRRMLTYHKKNGTADDGTLLGVRVDKLKHPDTKAYAQWVAASIRQNPKSFDDWANSRGIVATRERFLNWYEQNGGSREDSQAKGAKQGQASREDYDRVLLIPVAVPGCGSC